MRLIFIFLSACILSLPLLGENSWEDYKAKSLSTMSTIPGWCSQEKASLIMDLIHENQCTRCIEIGVFAGKSLFPIAQALRYQQNGVVFGIDAWNPNDAVAGFRPSDSSYSWWNEIDYNKLHRNTLYWIFHKKLEQHCSLIKTTSCNAAELFEDGTIDFIHLDGNHNEFYSYQDVLSFFPKVRDGGFILLNDPNWISMRRSLVFLLERTDLLSSFSSKAEFLLFRKNAEKEKRAQNLMQDTN